MVDVLHYYFEEDLHVSTGEEAEAKSESRSVIYRTLYGSTYKYAMPKSKSSRGFSSASGDRLPDEGFYGQQDLAPFDPEKNVTKPFIPATDFDADSPLPFGRELDAPLG